MKLVQVDVRFFRSFNYDYELKAKVGSRAAQWEEPEPNWFPFVRVPLELDITAVVGANEAGKSQLLTAIKAALTGTPIDRSDFCRYSELYSVQEGAVRSPEFGGIFRLDESDDDVRGIPGLETTNIFTLYRPGDADPFLVVDGQKIPLTPTNLIKVDNALPRFHELRTDLAIPDSVSISELAGRPRSALDDRRNRSRLLTALSELTAGSEPEDIGAAVRPSLILGPVEGETKAQSRRKDEFDLARALLVDTAHVEPTIFNDLEAAVLSGREGRVEAIVGGINTAIRENLNIQRWWTQDQDFELRVEARERELAFTILDRTTSKYSFDERSQGLRFFLSYFVQLAAHRLRNSKPDVLLLDEPDAYLSSTGQQDLLRVLEDYAFPESDGPRNQVVYVTHSPFLIDKNAPYRIRVLDKGSQEEGTRVVRDAANNRYEPLRSSLGQYVAETAFIGGRNLFVEGVSDQVLLAGATSVEARLTDSGYDSLNLNDVTIVASGGADGIPYMVYLARGRDSVKPPCVALLDGDQAGQDAERVLKRGEARKKRVLADEFIVRLDSWAKENGVDPDPGVTILEIEDLLPIGLARSAALNYLARFVSLDDVSAEAFTSSSISAKLAESNNQVWPALTSCFSECFPSEHLEKIGLAREVVNLVEQSPHTPDSISFRTRFGLLLQSLSLLLEQADREEQSSRTSNRLKRAVASFESNYPNGIKKMNARRVLRDIVSALGDSVFSDELRTRAMAMERNFELTDFSEPEVRDFQGFKRAVRGFAVSERLAYQDDSDQNPASAIPDLPSSSKYSVQDAG